MPELQHEFGPIVSDMNDFHFWNIPYLSAIFKSCYSFVENNLCMAWQVQLSAS